MSVIYETTIQSAGDLVNSFDDEKIIILFGEQAPDSLKDFCYTVKIAPLAAPLSPNQTLWIGEQSFTITAVGTVASKNLQDLGHITICFNGAQSADIAGSICVNSSDIPAVIAGNTLKITA